LSWTGLAKALIAIPTLITAGVGVVVVVLALIVTYAELSGSLVVIEPFDVPEVLEKNHGYTSRVIASKLTDHLTRIRTTARTSMQRRQFVTPGAENAHLHVLGPGVNLEAVLPFVWALWGKEPFVSWARSS
jgi:Na+-transporting methylmalonyl-CoA/oxaloacetate decarboxylase gamma subunit